MAEALLITRNDLVRLTALNGNVDTDKFIQFIKIAQDIHIEHYLGTQLIEKIKTLILNGDINEVAFEDYKDLLEIYVKPMVIYWAMVEYLPNAAYTIANKGVYKHSSENAENVEKTEVDFLINKYSNIAKEYKLVSFWITKKGYLRLAIAKDGIQRKHLVHRLVADAFIENPLNKEQVNHINGIKSDNRVENLEWVTNYENFSHSVLMGKQKHIKDYTKYIAL